MAHNPYRFEVMADGSRVILYEQGGEWVHDVSCQCWICDYTRQEYRKSAGRPAGFVIGQAYYAQFQITDAIYWGDSD